MPNQGRLASIIQLIESSDISIHDLSRVELSRGLPRFNMPVELAVKLPEGVKVEFTPDALDAIAHFALQVNQTMENIGARRLHTVLERLLEDVLYQAPEIELFQNVLRHGQLVLKAAGTVYQRHLTKLMPGPLLQVSRPVHARVLMGPQTTVLKTLVANRMPTSVVSAEFRKVARARGPVLRAVAPNRNPIAARPLLARLALGYVFIHSGLYKFGHLDQWP